MAAQINAEGLNLIKLFEGLRLEAYLDAVGIWTIGYGHTAGVKQGDTLTPEQAETQLEYDLRGFESGVSSLVHVPLNENEFSALVSLAYNIGLGNLSTSTVIRRLSAGDRLGAAAAIEMWNKGHVNGQLVILPGLTRRRAAEKALFLKPVAEAGHSDALDLNTRLPPAPERGDQRPNLSDSRTIQGGVVAGGAGAVAAAGAASQSATTEKPATPTPQDVPVPVTPAPATPPVSTPDTSTPPASTPTPTEAPAPSSAPVSLPPAPTTETAPNTSGTTAPSIVQRTADTFRDFPQIYLVCGALVVLAVIWIVWARVDDWRKGLR